MANQSDTPEDPGMIFNEELATTITKCLPLIDQGHKYLAIAEAYSAGRNTESEKLGLSERRIGAIIQHIHESHCDDINREHGPLCREIRILANANL